VHFATAASQNDCYMIKDESNESSNCVCHFLNNIGFLMQGKLISTESFLYLSENILDLFTYNL
jgi:hypothetical protein